MYPRQGLVCSQQTEVAVSLEEETRSMAFLVTGNRVLSVVVDQEMSIHRKADNWQLDSSRAHFHLFHLV